MISPKWVSFVDNFINSLSNIVPINSFFSYELNTPDIQRIESYYYKNMAKKTLHSYVDHMFKYDPLFYKNNEDTAEIVALNDKNIPPKYAVFLEGTNLVDNIELFFKDGSHNIGSISLHRLKGEDSFSSDEVLMIQSCYSLAAFNTKNILASQHVSYDYQYCEMLTKQEKKVISLILTGKKNQEIADTLFVSLTTVKTHLRNIFKKLKVNSKQELIIKVH